MQRWPSGNRSAAIFSFDVDDEHVMRVIYGEQSYYVSQGQYDTRAGIWRVLDMLRRNNVKGTFCVVGKVAEARPDVVQAVKENGHEIAAHGYDHTPYYKLSRTKEKQDILKTNRALEKVTGERPVGQRTPEWNPSPNTIRLLAQVGGFLWNSDYLNDDVPYRIPTGVRQQESIIELPVAATLDDWPLIIERGMSPTQVGEVWKAEFDSLRDEGKLFVLTTHPLIIGRPSWSRALREIIQYAKTFNDVWIATAREVATWWNEQNPV